MCVIWLNDPFTQKSLYIFIDSSVIQRRIIPIYTEMDVYGKYNP